MNSSVVHNFAVAGVERRRHERRGLRGVAHLVLRERGPIEVHMLDISAGGIGIVGVANPQPETVGSVRFSMPTSQFANSWFDAEVEVTHSIFSSDENGFKIGLRFLKIPSTLAAAIAAYIKQ
jgi:c-di-GMP-binding flagellar brake protein YcgR